jgi:hypothetical protein
VIGLAKGPGGISDPKQDDPKLVVDVVPSAALNGVALRRSRLRPAQGSCSRKGKARLCR